MWYRVSAIKACGSLEPGSQVRVVENDVSVGHLELVGLCGRNVQVWDISEREALGTRNSCAF